MWQRHGPTEKASRLPERARGGVMATELVQHGATGVDDVPSGADSFPRSAGPTPTRRNPSTNSAIYSRENQYQNGRSAHRFKRRSTRSRTCESASRSMPTPFNRSSFASRRAKPRS